MGAGLFPSRGPSLVLGGLIWLACPYLIHSIISWGRGSPNSLNRAQEELFRRTIGCWRLVYNLCLEQKNEYLRRGRRKRFFRFPPVLRLISSSTSKQRLGRAHRSVDAAELIELTTRPFGSITVSITWMTPFDCLTSAW